MMYYNSVMKAIFYIIGYEKKGKRGIIVKKKLADAEKEYEKQTKTPGVIKICLLEYYSKKDYKILREVENETIYY